MFVYVFEPFHPPHVNRGDWHSGSNPDASDCSGDVEVVKTGGSPYQQPTSYLGGDRATMTFLLKFFRAKNARQCIGGSLTRGMQSRQMAARLPNLCARLTLFFKINKTLKSTRLSSIRLTFFQDFG